MICLSFQVPRHEKYFDFMKLSANFFSRTLNIKRAQLDAIRWYTLLEDHVDFCDPILYRYEEQGTWLTPQILRDTAINFPYIPM